MLFSVLPNIWRLRTCEEAVTFDSGLLTVKREIRSKLRIIAIDDEGFPYREGLESYGFTLTTRTTSPPGTELGQFAIVISDIMGVMPQNTNQHGLPAIEEYFNEYPLLRVVVLTGAQRNSNLIRRAEQSSDIVLSKQTALEDMVPVLDRLLADILSPTSQWTRMRNFLRKKGLNSKQLLLAEHYYTQSFIKNQPDIFSKGLGKLRTNVDYSEVLAGSVSAFSAVVKLARTLSGP